MAGRTAGRVIPVPSFSVIFLSGAGGVGDGGDGGGDCCGGGGRRMCN